MRRVLSPHWFSCVHGPLPARKKLPRPKVLRPRPGFVAVRGPADLFADGVDLKDADGRPWQPKEVSHQPRGLEGVELRIVFEASGAAAAPLQRRGKTGIEACISVFCLSRNLKSGPSCCAVNIVM